jgi:hypothetical protein
MPMAEVLSEAKTRLDGFKLKANANRSKLRVILKPSLNKLNFRAFKGSLSLIMQASTKLNVLKANRIVG